MNYLEIFYVKDYIYPFLVTFPLKKLNLEKSTYLLKVIAQALCPLPDSLVDAVHHVGLEHLGLAQGGDPKAHLQLLLGKASDIRGID